MGKGIIKINKTAKGKIIVSLDRLNGRPPVPLSYVTFQDDKLNDRECEYQSDSSGRITSILVDGQAVFGKTFDRPKPTIQQPHRQSDTVAAVRMADAHHPVYAFPDSISVRDSKLPREIRNLGIQDIDNFSLKYNKAARFVPAAPGKNKFFFFKNDLRRRRDGSETGDRFFIKPNFGSLNFEGISFRQKSQVEALFQSHRCLKFSPDWRLICGLSGGIYETNMTLHHVYGVPFIPASSIKGVVRSWIITSVFGATAPETERNYPMVNAEYRALKNSKIFCEIFGSPESIERVVFEDGKPKTRKDKNGTEKVEKEKDISAVLKEKQGCIVFMDALPENAPTLMPDIMNVHYPDWYNERSLPTDYQNPNPVIFLTVEQSSHFQTFLGTNKNQTLDKDSWVEDFSLWKQAGIEKPATLLDLAYTWLIKALSEHGIGAKTAAGYGYMKPE